MSRKLEIELEKRIVEKLIDSLFSAGFSVGTHNNDDEIEQYVKPAQEYASSYDD